MEYSSTVALPAIVENTFQRLQILHLLGAHRAAPQLVPRAKLRACASTGCAPVGCLLFRTLEREFAANAKLFSCDSRP